MSSPVKQNISICEQEIDKVDVLAWLSTQNVQPKFYWSSREGHLRRAGIGCVDRLRGKSLNDLSDVFRRMRGQLSGTHLSYFGGMAFNDRCCGDEWEAFGAYDFLLPEVEIYESGDRMVLRVYGKGDENLEAKIKSWLKTIKDIPERTSEAVRVSQGQNPDFEVWERTLSQVFDDFDRQIYQKIVLARRKEFGFDGKVDAFRILKSLRADNINTCSFLWMPDAGHAFVGSTPERLFKRTGRRIESEAVAGTKPRGKNNKEDLSIEKDLLSSLKNESEHRFVVDYLLKTFRQLCREYSYDKTIQLLKLTDNQHLLTKFQGILKDDVLDDAVIRALHPTPAVGGFPRESAVAKILSYETFNRGWFSGLIGFAGMEESEFAVAIRSGLVSGNRVYAYAGAGIVEGSEAQDEWDEIDGKMKGFLKILLSSQA